MIAFETLRSRVVPLPLDDVDTDQIIPARHLKVVDKAGLGKHLFDDWRRKPDGSDDPDFALNVSAFRGAKVLLAGANFGCGSSREHAPWALQDWGFRAIVAPSFADIFRNNALKNGLLPVALPRSEHARLLAAVLADPAAEVEIDLGTQQIALPWGGVTPFEIDAFARRCLLAGVDELGYLLSLHEKVDAYERRRSGEGMTIGASGAGGAP